MLQVIVRGVKSKKLISEIKDCTKFYLSKLLKKKQLDKLTVYISVDTKKMDNCGECIPNGKDITTGRDEYEIKCVHQPRKDPFHGNVFKNIAHEVVHLKQYVTGQLGRFIVTQKNPSGKGLTGTLWEGKIYDIKLDDFDETYYTSPWEIEAYGREVGLYRLWRQSRGKPEYR